MKHYDLIIIGSGSGLMVLEAALAKGLSCAIVERSKFGGTCLTKGCIPSKMLVYPADLIRDAEQASRIGVQLELLQSTGNVSQQGCGSKSTIARGLQKTCTRCQEWMCMKPLESLPVQTL